MSAGPGRIAPPRKSPAAETRFTVVAVPQSTTIAGRAGSFTTAAAAAAATRSMPTRCGSSTSTVSGRSAWPIRRWRTARCRVAETSATAASSRTAAASWTLATRSTAGPGATPASQASRFVGRKSRLMRS